MQRLGLLHAEKCTAYLCVCVCVVRTHTHTHASGYIAVCVCARASVCVCVCVCELSCRFALGLDLAEERGVYLGRDVPRPVQLQRPAREDGKCHNPLL
jgi:hypothetical protein